MNSDSVVIRIGGTSRNQIATQTLASTSETEFQVNTDNGAGAIAVLTIPQQTAVQGSTAFASPSGNPAELGSYDVWALANPIVGSSRPYFSSAQFDSARPFLVRLAGVATPVSNAANTLTLKIYSGTSKSGTAIVTTGALTGTETSTAASAFVIETECFWDSVGQKLCGAFWYNVNAATPAFGGLATNSAIATVTSVANLSFCASAQWGNAVGGTITIGEFSITMV